ncbi:MAG: TIGR04013 family B12-binding domain/radical SAM domain-containing protein, partial [Candidatus Lokiarchaeota archaeon]|nr:TIGR04013 family B12-binding domain/radical SAM domain-containing protein [Candidatus Lokiarchaeota archaeon]
MRKPLIVFGVSKPNVYSYAKILGAIEQDSTINELFEIRVIRKNPYRPPFYSLMMKKMDLRNRPYVIIMFSVLSAQFPNFQKAMSSEIPKIREINKNLITIAGGWHVTGSPVEALDCGVDFCILGESEYILGKLLNIIGCSFPKGNLKSVKNSLKDMLNQNELNHLAFKHLDRIYLRDIRKNIEDSTHFVVLDDYIPYSEKYRVFAPIEISRGCPFRCKFCQTGSYWKYMRHASVDCIVKWVKHAVEIKYDRVWFLSSNSFAYGSKNGTGTNPSLVKRLLKEVKAIPDLDEIYFGTFPSEVRPEYVTPEMIDAIKEYISNEYFSIGAQSASDRLLRSINRGHCFADVENATDILTEYGYGVDIDFIFGLPGETKSDIDKTIDFFKEILKSPKKILIHTHKFMPL